MAFSHSEEDPKNVGAERRIDHGDIIRGSSNERTAMKRTLLQKVQYQLAAHTRYEISWLFAALCIFVWRAVLKTVILQRVTFLSIIYRIIQILHFSPHSLPVQAPRRFVSIMTEQAISPNPWLVPRQPVFNTANPFSPINGSCLCFALRWGFIIVCKVRRASANLAKQSHRKISRFRIGLASILRRFVDTKWRAKNHTFVFADRLSWSKPVHQE